MKFNICFSLFLSAITLSTFAKTRTEATAQIIKENITNTEPIARTRTEVTVQTKAEATTPTITGTLPQTKIKLAPYQQRTNSSLDNFKSISRTEALDNYFSALHKNKQFSGNVLIAEREIGRAHV